MSGLSQISLYAWQTPPHFVLATGIKFISTRQNHQVWPGPLDLL